MTNQTYSKGQLEAIQTLKNVLPSGSTVFIQFLAVNKDQSQRLHTFFTVVSGDIWKLDYYIAQIMDKKLTEYAHSAQGILTGYDNGESLINGLASKLYDDINALKTRRWQ